MSGWTLAIQSMIAVVTAAIGFWAGRSGRAAEREVEAWKRLTWAVELALDPEPRKSATGWVMLEMLNSGDTGRTEDRDLARGVLGRLTTLNLGGGEDGHSAH